MHSTKDNHPRAGYHYDKKLEGLRGLCAITVAYAHLFTFDFFGASKLKYYAVFEHLQFAHVAVLVFFILSGYVIGVSHLNTPFNKKNVFTYFKKRAVRLYPIYLIALLISVSFNPGLVRTQQVVGHLLFLQEFFVKQLATNPVFWSLSYEVAYYLLFILLWAIKGKRNLYYTIIVIAILAYALTGSGFNVFKSLLVGWIFWIAGLLTSAISVKDNDEKLNFVPLLSYFFILLATCFLASGGLIIHMLHTNIDVKKMISFDDLVYLPICLVIIMTLTKRLYNLFWIQLIAYIIPTFTIIVLLYFGHPIISHPDRPYGIIYFCLGIITATLTTNIHKLEKLNFAGKMSYAVYVLHFPICFYLSRYLSSKLTGNILFIAGTIIWVILTIGLSFLCDIKLQPKFKKLFLKGA